MTVIKSSALNNRRGADVLLETLHSEGVEYIFGNPGTTELPLMDALLRNPSLKYVLCSTGGQRGGHGRWLCSGVG